LHFGGHGCGVFRDDGREHGLDSKRVAGGLHVFFG